MHGCFLAVFHYFVLLVKRPPSARSLDITRVEACTRFPPLGSLALCSYSGYNVPIYTPHPGSNYFSYQLEGHTGAVSFRIIAILVILHAEI